MGLSLRVCSMASAGNGATLWWRIACVIKIIRAAEMHHFIVTD